QVRLLSDLAESTEFRSDSSQTWLGERPGSRPRSRTGRACGGIAPRYLSDRQAGSLPIRKRRRETEGGGRRRTPMMFVLAYLGRSAVKRDAGGLAVSLAPNLRRDRVSFRGTLAQPLRFREAVSALHDVVVS